MNRKKISSLVSTDKKNFRTRIGNNLPMQWEEGRGEEKSRTRRNKKRMRARRWMMKERVR